MPISPPPGVIKHVDLTDADIKTGVGFHGVGTDYIAKTSRSDQLTDFYSQEFWFRDYHTIQEVTVGSGAVIWRGDYCEIESGTTANSYAQIYHRFISRFGKNIEFEALARVRTTLDQEGYIICGYYGTSQHIGFMFDGTNVLGTVADGTTQSTTVLQALSDTWINFKAVLTSGVKCEFYLDRVLKATITTNLPTGNTIPGFFARIKNTAAANKEINIKKAIIRQDW